MMNFSHPVDDKSKNRFRTFDTVFQISVFCIALVVLVQNFSLSSQNKQLRSAASARRDAYASTLVKVGSKMRDLLGLDLDGKPRPIPLPQNAREKLLVVTMSPSCPICESNRRGWMALSEELRRNGNWRVVWVSRDPVPETRQYFEPKGIRDEAVIADPTHRTYAQLSLERVPTLLVVNSAGSVEKIWGGALSPGLTQEIRSYLAELHAEAHGPSLQRTQER